MRSFSKTSISQCLIAAVCFAAVGLVAGQCSFAQDSKKTLSNTSLPGEINAKLDVGGKVDDLAWIPNSNEIVVVTQAIRPGPRSVKVWDVSSGTKLRELAVSQKPILSVAISPDGKRVAGGVWHESPVASEVLVWSTHGNERRIVLAGKSPESETTKMKSEILGVAFSPDGSLIAGAFKLVSDGQIVGSHIGGEVCVWDVATGKLKWSDRTTHTDIVYAVAFSPDGHLLASGGTDKLVRFWKPDTGELQKTLHGAAWDGITSLAFLTNGAQIASGGVGREEGRFVRVWNVKSGRHLHTFHGFMHGGTVRVASNVSSSLVFAAGMIQDAPDAEPKWQVKGWDATSGKLLYEFDGQPGYCRAISVKQDGSRLAIGTAENQVFIFNLKN